MLDAVRYLIVSDRIWNEYKFIRVQRKLGMRLKKKNANNNQRKNRIRLYNNNGHQTDEQSNRLKCHFNGNILPIWRFSASRLM